jgi:hypothetical protein
MTKPRLLDLFSGAGGAGMGYQRAGFYVVGVDIEPQPNYCGDEFVQSDALEYLAAHGHEFDAVHGSPPCQGYSWSARRWENTGTVYPKLIKETREALIKTGKPYVMENVIGAPLNTVIELCGSMFGLRVFKHRRFETSFLMFQPYHMTHTASIGFGENDFVTIAGHGGDGSARMDNWQDAVGIDWMDKKEMAEAIPPAYTEYIGAQLMQALQVSS